MATFTRLEVWTDVACASGVRVAAFDPALLASAVLKTSLAGVESLAFVTARGFTQAAQLIHGRVVRVCWSDTSLDTEWRINEIVDQSGAGDSGQVAVGCQSILLDLARAPYVDWDSAGHVSFAFSAVQLTPSEWIDNYVLPACTEAGMSWVARGTVDYTTEFDLDGEYVTALEILRAMQQAGRAPGELALRRNGATDYKIDLLVGRNLTATTVRVQTRKNLLANQRTRRFQDIGTKIIPRGSAESVQSGIAHAIWRVQTVVDGTHADLEDPLGGADPIAYDDQINGCYVAPITSSFSSQQITDCTASNSRITVASTAGWSDGVTLLRVFRTSGASGEEMISLSHPTRVAVPSAGGFGVVTRILDVPGGSGDSNLLTSNPWMSTWATSTAPAAGYTKITGGLSATASREATTVRLGTYSYKFVINADSAFYVHPSTPSAAITGTTAGYIGVYTPTITPYTTAGKRFSAHAWVYLTSRTNGGVQLVAADASTLVPFAWGPVAITTDTWVKLELTGLSCSARTNGVVLAVISAPDWIEGQTSWGQPWATDLTFYVDSFGFIEADATPAADVQFSAANALWQRANVALASISDVVTGYTVTLADLARLDDTAWSDEPLTLGGYLEIVDADLSVTTTQRVVELEQSLLNPLVAAVQLATPETLLTKMLAGSTVSGGGTISGSTGIVTSAPQTAAGLGVTDVYTKAEIDALLSEKAPIGTTAGIASALDFVGLRITSVGNAISVNTNSVATPADLFDVSVSGYDMTLCEVYGNDNDTNCFFDVVAVDNQGTPTLSVISSTDVRGAPPARTYTVSGPSTLKLGLGGAGGTTYSCAIGVRLYDKN